MPIHVITLEQHRVQGIGQPERYDAQHDPAGAQGRQTDDARHRNRCKFRPDPSLCRPMSLTR